ncbi:MAG: hypothetical protein KGJ23_07805 [Euryarchaeota archaeon]|nr:hypothetical protein [Euryarchaeota archaeon]MDE1836504.1 hypothetical protein [Euryarchaeota archaeon]MDE1879301.1 hypothetical protein [Euryarchaeota archaeon]MDE2044474.1 hypothetical protein [Thermoplasmata archaeon]
MALDRAIREYRPVEILLAGHVRDLKSFLDRAAEVNVDGAWDEAFRRAGIGVLSHGEQTLVRFAAWFWNGEVTPPSYGDVLNLDAHNREKLLEAYRVFLMEVHK